MNRAELIEAFKLYGGKGCYAPTKEQCAAAADMLEADARIIQSITDPENQPSQYGTVTVDYHLAKIAEWEKRFERVDMRCDMLEADGKPLTDEEIEILLINNGEAAGNALTFARAIEAHIRGEKE